VTFSFSTKIGIVYLQNLHSATFGLGMVSCWVDGLSGKDRAVKVDSYWDLPYNIGR